MKRKVLTNADIFRMMETWAPKNLAYDWDNVGLQIGSYQERVHKIMITLDVTESVVEEAIEKDVSLIIAHHPLLFKPMKYVNVESAQGRIIQKLLTNGITVYASHTNLDVAEGGVNDMLCDKLGIDVKDILVETMQEKLYKLTVYVPDSHQSDVRQALSESGAGHIGNYSHCTFQTNGQGTFKPLQDTNPFIGTFNEIEFVDEVRIETIVPQTKLQDVINKMIAVHPYEEVAYDVYPLKNEGKKMGIGRFGTLPRSMKLESLCEHVKQVLDVPGLRVVGDLNKEVRKVAVLGGSGEKYIHAAKRMGADVYITGDMTFHIAQEAETMGLSVIDPGHYIEKVMKNATKEYLQTYLDSDTIEIIISDINTEPFKFL